MAMTGDDNMTKSSEIGSSFNPLDLSASFNCGLRDKLQGAHPSGWLNLACDFRNLKPGILKAGKVEFDIIDPVTQSRHKTYYAMKAFNLMTKYENRISTEKEPGDNIWALSGRKDTGETAVLLSCFKTGNRRIIINFGDYKFNPDQCRVSVIDADRDLTPMEHVKITGNIITLEKPAGSAVFLVEIMK